MTEETPTIYFYMLGGRRIIFFTGRQYVDYYFAARKRAPYLKGGNSVEAKENISSKTYPAVVAKSCKYLYIRDGDKWIGYQRAVRRKLTEADFKRMEEDHQSILSGKTKTYTWEEVQAHAKAQAKVQEIEIRMQRKLYKRQYRLWKNHPLNLTEDNFSLLKKLHIQAKTKGLNVFQFEDKKVISDYAGILIENLGHQFKKRKS